MRQTLGFIAVWCGATVLAISVAWFGVRDVLRSEVFDDAKVEPISAAITRTGSAPLPTGAPTGPVAVGTPTTSALPSRPTPVPGATSVEPVQKTARPQTTDSPLKGPQTLVRPQTSVPESARSSVAPKVTWPASAPTATQSSAVLGPTAQMASNENVRVVNVRGGSVSFVIEGGRCRLITAAPHAGFEAKVAQNIGWIRVDLVQGQRGSAVFCIGGENRTDIWEY